MRGGVHMTDLWYCAEGDETRGPVSLTELVPLMAGKADPRRVLIWRDGFAQWKPLEEVREVAKEVFRPPPLHKSAPPPPPVSDPPVIREPAVDAEDAAAFKNVKPELSGLGGWLTLVALGQIIGFLRFAVDVGKYYAKDLDEKVWTQFPLTMWGEAAMNVFLAALFVCTIVLMFRRSREFPRYFIAQFPVVILTPFVSNLWVALTLAAATGKSMTEFMSMTEKEAVGIFTTIVGAAIWIPYMLRSQRVKNTFVN